MAKATPTQTSTNPYFGPHNPWRVGIGGNRANPSVAPNTSTPLGEKIDQLGWSFTEWAMTHGAPLVELVRKADFAVQKLLRKDGFEDAGPSRKPDVKR
jgi:hypothetical protein